LAHVIRCERDEELHPDRIYWVYHVQEDAVVEMLFAVASRTKAGSCSPCTVALSSRRMTRW
jgi:hypothetical protein